MMIYIIQIIVTSLILLLMAGMVKGVSWPVAEGLALDPIY